MALMFCTPPAITTSWVPLADALGGEVHGLLAGAALTVDGGAGHAQRSAGREPRGAADVSRLRADGVEAAEDDVVDDLRVDSGAVEQAGDDLGAEVGRVHGGEGAVLLADGGADGVDDVGLGVPHCCSPDRRVRAGQARWLEWRRPHR